MSKQKSIFWHDYETFGLVPGKDGPSQFAGIRTDLELNIISEPVMWYCKPLADALPDPESGLITGISPLLCEKKGLPEYEFAHKIWLQLSQADTIGCGYNTIRFDDEMTRFMLWRNFYKPYEREYSNGCGRWDLIDTVRCVYALKPETLTWPKNEQTGQDSLKLDRLSIENQLSHQNAHDALSDVQVTIDLARLIRERQPKLFDFCMSMRNREAVLEQLHKAGYQQDLPSDQRHGVVHISGMFGGDRCFMAMVWPICQHPTNAQEVITWDLKQDPSELLALSPAQIRERIFSASAELEQKGLTRLPIKNIHLKKSPIVITNRRVMNDELAQRAQIDWDVVTKHEDILRHIHTSLTQLNWTEIFERDFDNSHLEAESRLYVGGFVPDSDMRELGQSLDQRSRHPNGRSPQLVDMRLSDMWWRYKARHFPETLSEPEQLMWQEWLSSIFLGDEHHIGVQGMMDKLNDIAQKQALTEAQIEVFEEYAQYYQQRLDYLEHLQNT